VDKAVPKTIRVIVADDHSVVREGLRRMFEGTTVSVVGEARTGSEAVEATTRLKPDVVLLDIRMPDVDGLAALREIKRLQPQIPVVMLTAYDDPAWLVQALAYGAAGYLLKSLSREALVVSVETVARGDALLSPAHLKSVIRELGAVVADAAGPLVGDLSRLTAREGEVLALLTEGLTNEQIASVLHIASSTVKTHVESVMIKLGASDRTQAAVMAARAGITRKTMNDE
jgi:DNA-binding NarL/FixJ family response regulator